MAKQFIKRGLPTTAACLCAFLALAGSASATFPGANGKITFERFNVEANGDNSGPFIFSINPDGSELRQLTFTGHAFMPAWSADGSKLVFMRDDPRNPTFGPKTLWTMNADGTDERQIPMPSGTYYRPSWAPDGQSLVFYGRVGTGQWGVHTMTAEGAALRLVAPDGSDPAWSPDGREIAFRSDAGRLTLINADGTNRRETPHFVAGKIDWSPDGSRIASGGFVVNSDGTDAPARRVPPFAAGPYDVRWSPDGQQVVASGNGAELFVAGIQTIRADGSGLRVVTTDGCCMEWLDWQPVPVSDTTPPTLSLPDPIATDATGPGGAIVSFSVTASDDRDTAPSVVCTPTSGTQFSIGTTTVACSATDASGNRAEGSFDVTVRGAAEQTVALNEELADLNLPKGTTNSLGVKLTRALDAFASDDVRSGCDALEAFANEVRAQSGKKIPAATASALIDSVARIMLVANCE